MAGYPNAPPNYGYGAPPSYPYTNTNTTSPGVPSTNSHPQYATPYAAPTTPYPIPGDQKPPKQNPGMHGGAQGGYSSMAPPASSYGSAPPPSYGNPFASLLPSHFPHGTDPRVVECFQAADRDRSGFIDDKELQSALSSFDQSFSLRTVHLLMYSFTNTNTRIIGPKEFTDVYYSLQNWRGIFERFDRDRSGRIDMNELREALLSLGFSISPVVLELLVSKYDKSGGRAKAIEYDNFIECCLTVKGMTEKFRAKDTNYSGCATFNYEEFMLMVLPFLIA